MPGEFGGLSGGGLFSLSMQEISSTDKTAKPNDRSRRFIFADNDVILFIGPGKYVYSFAILSVTSSKVTRLWC
jgi:hypothetical protein